MDGCAVTKKFVQGLPKAELHLHLEGTLEPDLKLQLAQRNGVDIGQTTIDEVQAAYQFDSLTSFLNVYYPAMNVLQTANDFYQLALAYLKKAQRNGVKHVELFFDPQAHTSRGVSFATLFEGYDQAVQEAPALGIDAKLILCFLRDFSLESAEETYEEALPYRDRILGIGLDSDERDNPPEKFSDIFLRAKRDGFHTTVHCDIDQQNSIDHIRTALLDMGVERLDHGTNIVEDPHLVDYVKEKGIGMTCCPVSNSFVTADMKGKEIVDLLHQGVLVTVNSDDPAYFQSYVSDDLYTLAKTYHLSKEEVVQLAKNSFLASWISEDDRERYLQEVDQYVAGN